MKGFSSLGVVGLCAVIFSGCDSTPAPIVTSATPAFPAGASAADSPSDDLAVAWAEKVLHAAGGQERLAALHYLSFHFVVSAGTGVIADWRHDWDRRGNRYRLEGELPQGDHVLVLMHLNQQSGRVFQNGLPVPVEDAKPLLAMAYSRFLSDCYWLLLPFKLQDPGVRLAYQGEQKIEGATFVVLRLSFAEKTGLTPENSYRIFIDPATAQIRRWEFYATAGAAPLVAWWENWQSFNGVTLATERRLEGRNRKVLFEDIIASPTVNESLFAVPAQLSAKMF